ncbi:MAG: hypothetical protein V4736_11525, partial [Bdellovibrionota bacterium]
RIPSGESYEYFSKPANIDLADFSKNAKTGVVQLIGYDIFPFAGYTLLNQKVYSSFIASIGWEQTIGDQRSFWRTQMKANEPEISFPGAAGGVFTYVVNTQAFPKFQARPHLSKNTMDGTYKDDVRLFGRKQPGSIITSTQNSILNFEDDPTRFDWYYQARKPAQYNQSQIEIDYEGKTYKAYYELYRGYANELSFRLTGVPQPPSILIITEGAYNIWFEDFLYMNRTKWAKQTVGLSTKYFRSITPLKLVKGGEKINSSISVWTGDLKYRFTPGLWTRDETMGLMFSYESITYADVSTAIVGPGWFWARSMPRIFDDFMNLFPFMKYPKWVDMEVIYYGKTFNENTQLTDINMALNFHGQVLWKPNFFGEAGFGIRRIAFGLTNENTSPALTLYYGTVGLGYKF